MNVYVIEKWLVGRTSDPAPRTFGVYSSFEYAGEAMRTDWMHERRSSGSGKCACYAPDEQSISASLDVDIGVAVEWMIVQRKVL